MSALEIFEIDVPDPTDRIELVHELERRNLHAAAVDRSTVLVAVPRAPRDGAPSLLEPIVAVESWLERRDHGAVRVRARERTYTLRSRDGWPPGWRNGGAD